MSIWEWFKLNKRVGRLEQTLFNIQKENLTLMSIPFLDTAVDKIEEFDGEIVRGREVEEDESLLEEDSVEEREYQEEKRWEAQRKQKERMV